MKAGNKPLLKGKNLRNYFKKPCGIIAGHATVRAISLEVRIL